MLGWYMLGWYMLSLNNVLKFLVLSGLLLCNVEVLESNNYIML